MTAKVIPLALGRDFRMANDIVVTGAIKRGARRSPAIALAAGLTLKGTEHVLKRLLALGKAKLTEEGWFLT